jgi:hypothetical protein
MELELTLEEANLILAGLGELPAKDSMALIQRIHKEYNEQTQEESDGEDT